MKGFGQLLQRSSRTSFLATFDFGDVHAVYAGCFGQSRLGHAAKIAERPYRAFAAQNTVHIFGGDQLFLAGRQIGHGAVICLQVGKIFCRRQKAVVFITGDSDHLVHGCLLSVVNAATRPNFENGQHIALVVHNHAPIAHPEPDTLATLERLDVVRLRSRVGSISFDLRPDQRGRVGRHPGERFACGFGVGDLLHECSYTLHCELAQEESSE